MKKYIHEDFLLENGPARELYHGHAKDRPIIDFHNHLPPWELAQDRRFENMAQLWIQGDHYKWRAMRGLGIAEKFISGDATDREKFQKWAWTVPQTLRNPLFHWTQLELSRYFGIDDFLGPDTADAIYAACNEKLALTGFSARGLIDRMRVETLCTTDDPLDDLDHHRALAASPWPVQVLPTFRPDAAIHIEKAGFVPYLSDLSRVSGIPVVDFESLCAALEQRVDHFHGQGCRLSDHGLPHAYGAEHSLVRVNRDLKERLAGNTLSALSAMQFKSALFCHLGHLYASRDWGMQLHLGPIRDTNRAIMVQVGANAGVDSIGDHAHAEHLAGMLNRLNERGSLPRTVLYNSNPADNAVFATMAGNFSGEGIKGKVQFGAAWWFLDQMDGIEDQLNHLSTMGLLSSSVGMVTDSRSLLSFPRHEYYRRVLCNVLGKDIERGLLPNDMPWIGEMVGAICHGNAHDFFRFPKKGPPVGLQTEVPSRAPMG